MPTFPAAFSPQLRQCPAIGTFLGPGRDGIHLHPGDRQGKFSGNYSQGATTWSLFEALQSNKIRLQ
jgi:hypothetical protein